MIKRRPFAPAIPPRKIKFARDPEKYWHHGCAMSTWHFNALSLLTPIFENMVIGSIRKHKHQIQDHTLKLEVNSLILQEANHSSEFLRFNQDMVLRYYGHDLMKGRLKWFRWGVGFLPDSFKLAASAFGEHLATVSSEFLLTDKRWLEGVKAPIQDMWRWHSIEEIEHKHVAFDVYKILHGHYFVRTSTMFIFLMLFLVQYFSLIFAMMKKDKVSKVKGLCKLFALYWFKPGYFRQFVLPFLGYLKPYFHPNQRHNLQVAQKWRPILKPYTSQSN